MGRYYKIEVGGGIPVTFTNQVNGRNDSGAPQVELDLPVTIMAAPMGFAYAKIWGVSLQQISQANNLNGAPVTISGGMQAGLPLATADVGQAGVLVKGKVFASFGNWMGINQTLDLVIQTDGGATQSAPSNLVLNWKKGTPLSQALQGMLTTAYPDLPAPKINISPNLVLNQDEAHVTSTLEQFAAWLKPRTQSIIGGNYPGVDLTTTGNVITAYDGTSPPPSTTLRFVDLIGQPTWLGAFQIQFATVMRADLAIGDSVTFPKLAGFQTVTTRNSQSSFRNQSTFQGTWQVFMIRHLGNSRGASAQDWITTFQANSTTPPTPASVSSPADTSA